MRRDKGFTLIELLIVIAIIGIIAAIAIPSLLNALERARQTTTVANIKILGQGIEQYKSDNNNRVPTGDTIDVIAGILKEEEINQNDSIQKDGWSAVFIWDSDQSTEGNHKYTILSYGSDLAEGPDPEDAGIVKHFDEDIIWYNGVLTQKPEGSQTSR